MMNNELKFFTTAKGGTFFGLHTCDNAAVLCGEQKIAPVKVGSVDAAKEKHVPVVEVDGQKVTVKVGSVMHPMSAEHHIAWVCLRTKHGFQLKELPLDKEPVAEFSLTADDTVIEAFEFCNLHGVWAGK